MFPWICLEIVSRAASFIAKLFLILILFFFSSTVYIEVDIEREIRKGARKCPRKVFSLAKEESFHFQRDEMFKKLRFENVKI